MESGATPKKIYHRHGEKNSSTVCRLCASQVETRRLVRVFGISGVAKELALKVLTTCGIKITERDSVQVICRKCEGS